MHSPRVLEIWKQLCFPTFLGYGASSLSWRCSGLVTQCLDFRTDDQKIWFKSSLVFGSKCWQFLYAIGPFYLKVLFGDYAKGSIDWKHILSRGRVSVRPKKNLYAEKHPKTIAKTDPHSSVCWMKRGVTPVSVDRSPAWSKNMSS